MKEIIIEITRRLTDARINREPAHPNELDICNEIHVLFRKEFESLIDEGRIKVTGRNVRGQRIIKVVSSK